jgi:hypothetical protein
MVDIARLLVMGAGGVVDRCQQGEHRAANQLDGRHRHSMGRLSLAQATWESEEAAFSTHIHDPVDDGRDDTRDPCPGGF